MEPPSERHEAGARLSGNVALIGLALVTGAASGYAALALLWLINRAQHLFLGFDHARVYSAAAKLDAWQVLLAPALGGLVVGIFVHLFIPGRRNHGPADAMQAVREGDGRMSLRAGLTSAVASAIAIGSGASLGRYGPTVHLGASVASWIGMRLKRVRAERHVLIGCGVAAAISASFNAPLAGVLFAHEVMLDAFARRGFVAIAIASVTGQAVARAQGAHFSLASLGGYQIGHNHEYLLFALVGVCGGITAIAYIRGLEWGGVAAGRVRVPQWCKPAIAGLILGALATRYPQVLGLGDEAIHDAIGQLFALPLLLALLAAKLFATCLCRGFGFPGGVIGPSLLMGALLGSALGQGLKILDPGLVSSVPVYAVAGMGALISCVMGAPLTTIVLVFELTGSYPLTTAVMVSVVLASVTVSRLFPYSWFNLQLLRRGVDVRAGREVRIMRDRRVAELVDARVPTLAPGASVGEALARMLELDAVALPVVDADGVLRGQIALAALMRAADAERDDEPVSDFATMPGIVLESDSSLDAAMKQLRYFMGVSVPVVDQASRMRFAGVVYQSSIIGAYDDAVAQAREEERGGG